jgi:hypothetical protein
MSSTPPSASLPNRQAATGNGGPLRTARARCAGSVGRNMSSAQRAVCQNPPHQRSCIGRHASQNRQHVGLFGVILVPWRIREKERRKGSTPKSEAPSARIHLAGQTCLVRRRNSRRTTEKKRGQTARHYRRPREWIHNRERSAHSPSASNPRRKPTHSRERCFFRVPRPTLFFRRRSEKL